MASTYSSDLNLELITTGEKAGTWGTITNNNLQQLEQASSGYVAVAVGGANVTLAISQGATSNGKNLYLKLTGTLTGNRQLIVPDNFKRIYIVEDATTRGSGANLYTLTVKTASGTGVTLAAGSTSIVYSDGTNVNKGMISQGWFTPTGNYTAVAGDRLLVNTSSNDSGINAAATMTLPATPAVGDEVTIVDSGNFAASNNITIGRNSSNINGAASNLTINTNSAAFTLVYVNATRGWVYKTTKIS
tara:strand:- start:5 stop:742 length:738 start_codon:yes stop_codon:yes gene_type:complete